MYIFIIVVVAIIATSPPTNKPADIKVDQTKSAITKTIATPKTTVQKVKPSKQIVKEVVKPKKINKSSKFHYFNNLTFVNFSHFCFCY